jgi:hypothetical protein
MANGVEVWRNIYTKEYIVDMSGKQITIPEEAIEEIMWLKSIEARAKSRPKVRFYIYGEQ